MKSRKPGRKGKREKRRTERGDSVVSSKSEILRETESQNEAAV